MIVGDFFQKVNIMKKLEFKAIENNEMSKGVVTAYLHEPLVEMKGFINNFPNGYREKYPSVIVCPGGAYLFTSQREADPVTFEYLSAGYNVFILNYSVGELAKDFLPLKELSSLIMTIRDHSDEWGCDSDKIAVCGFSAGGHLAASSAILWNNEKFKTVFDTENGKNKPNAAVLAYPVITADEFAHEDSIKSVSGAEKGTEKYDFFSLDKRVDSDCAPIFVWHTVTDGLVPVENTIKLITELQKNKISFECHIFPDGDHGMSVCTNEVSSPSEHNNQWVKLSKNWLNKIFDYKL